MLFAARSRAHVKEGRTKFLVDQEVFPQTLSVLRTRAAHLDIDMVVLPRQDMVVALESGGVYGCLFQYPDANGEAEEMTEEEVAADSRGEAGAAGAADRRAARRACRAGRRRAGVLQGHGDARPRRLAGPWLAH